MPDFNQMNVVNLRKQCKRMKLPTSGNKNDLIIRLQNHYANMEFDDQADMVNGLNQRIAQLERTLVQYQTSRQDQEVPRTHFEPTIISTPYVRPGVNTVLFVPTTSAATQQPLSTISAVQDAPTTYVTASHAPATMNTVQYTTAANATAYHTPIQNAAYQNATGYMPTTGNAPQNTPYVRFFTPPPAAHPVSIPMMQSAPPVNVVPPVSQIVDLLPSFDPMSKSLTSEQFLRRVELLMSTYNWNEQIVLFAVQQKMKGSAKYWMDSLEIVFTNWNQFASRFRTDFPCNINTADIHIQMARTKRQTNETPQEFYYKMIAMGNAGNLSEPDIIRHIVNGINEIDLKRKISNNYQFCHQLLADINAYTTYNDVKTPSYNKVPSFNKMATPKPIEQQEQTARPQFYDYKCFNCGKKGHLAAQCPEPPRKSRCNVCNKTTHATEVCPTKKSNINKILTQDCHQHIAKEVMVEGHKTMAFVDPGSKHTLVRSSFANDIGTSVLCAVILKGFAGGEYLCKNKIKATIKIDDLDLDAELLVVDDNLLMENVLLGQDLLCRDDHRVIIQKNECIIENVNAIQSANSLTHDEKEQLNEIITQYASVFAKDARDIGKCSISKPSIELTTDEPVRLKPYRVAFAKRQIINDLVKELLDCGIVRPSESPYASPVVLVEKKNGEHRLCVDYRCLNKITKRIPFPMPIMEEQFAQLAGSTYFTTLDLRMGYYQLELEESSKKYTAFITTEGHFEFDRSSFGLVNAPAYFQAVMNKIVAKMGPGEVLAYLDDVIIPSRSVQEGLQRLSKFLGILKDVNLTLRMDKCQFLATEINHLGHVINQNGISPGENKITAIKNFKIPTNVTEVRRFLGITGFFRKFVAEYAQKTKPLTMLLHKNQQFIWGQEQQLAFDKLIQCLVSAPVLALYDINAQHEVHTDASAIGIAGILMQSSDGKTWKPVSYYSRHCSEAEAKLHGYELEVLAVVDTLERFRIYLLGRTFRLVTDCSAIATIKSQMKPKIARWWMRLLEYDFVAVHRAGSKLAHVDALSRSPDEPPKETESAGFVFKVDALPNDWLLSMQLQDEKLREIIYVLNGTQKSDQEKQYRQEYELKKNHLYRKQSGKLRFVVPKAVRWRILQYCHDDMGHFALDKTMERIQQNFWFPRMRKYVKEYIAACINCCYHNTRGGKPEGEMHISDLEPIPFASVHIDHLGPFVKSKKGNSYVIAISDAFTKYLVVKAVRNTKTLPVLQLLNEMTSYFGLPRKITSDRGTAFTAKLFEDYCDKHNIRHVKCAVRTPRANGQVERANQLILSFIKKGTKEAKDWDSKMGDLQWTVNSQKNRTTGFSPNELVFDFDIRNVVQNKLLAAVKDENSDNELPSAEKRQQALQNMMQEREKWKKRFDEKHAQPTRYNELDLVVLHNEPAATGQSRKLEPKFRGPFMITKCLENDRYLVENIPGSQRTRKFCSVYASDKIKPWCRSNPDLDSVDIEPDEDASDSE